MASAVFSSDLGTLSILPPELRDRIYSHVLDFSNQIINDNVACSCCRGCPAHRKDPMTILWTSKRIHQEAKIVYFQCNEFEVAIDRDYKNQRTNRSVIGLLGWNLLCADRSRAAVYWNDVPYKMMPYMRRIHLTVGGADGCTEVDVVPPLRRSISGPERPTFIVLQRMVEDVCAIFASCHQLHHLRISIRSIEEKPRSIENLLVPVRKLRGIRRTETVVWSMQENMWVDWNLKGSYGRYLNRLLALPKGSPPMKYVGDEREPNQSEDKIFDKIGGWWNGEKGFTYPPAADSGSEFDLDDPDFNEDWDDIDPEEEYDDFQEFIHDPEAWWGMMPRDDKVDDETESLD